jgi:hypothetical protein
VVEATLTPSAAYVTGGDTLDPKLLGLRSVRQIVEASHDSGGSGPGAMTSGKTAPVASRQVGASIDLAGTDVAPLIRIHDAQGVEVANASNNSARGPFRVRVYGF